MIGFGSLGCSHVSQFLHAINETTFTSVDSLKDRDGRLNKEKLFREDPVLVNLALHGLTWHVIRLDFIKRFPAIPKLFSKDLNAEHNIAEGES